MSFVDTFVKSGFLSKLDVAKSLSPSHMLQKGGGYCGKYSMTGCLVDIDHYLMGLILALFGFSVILAERYLYIYLIDFLLLCVFSNLSMCTTGYRFTYRVQQTIIMSNWVLLVFLPHMHKITYALCLQSIVR